MADNFPKIVPALAPVPLGTLPIFDLSSGHLPMFSLAVQPDFYIDAIGLSQANKGGYDIAQGKEITWSSTAITIVGDAGFAGRPVIDFGTKYGDIRLWAPTTQDYTILIVASLDASQYSSSNHSALITVLDEELTDNISLFWEVFAPPITANGGAQFSPDITVNSNSGNMDGTYLPAAGVAGVYVLTFKHSTLQSKQYVNSTTARLTTTHLSDVAVSPEQVWCLGSRPLLTQGSDPRGWLGKMACAVKYPAVLSNGDLGTAIAALKARYGIV